MREDGEESANGAESAGTARGGPESAGGGPESAGAARRAGERLGTRCPCRAGPARRCWWCGSRSGGVHCLT